MDALVLGGSRFVGLHLTRLLDSQGHNVTVLNRGSTPVDLPDGVERLMADRKKPSEVKTALKGKKYDAVFDVSGYVAADLEPVIEALEGNIDHYVLTTTTAVYNLGDVTPIGEDFPLNWDAPEDSYAGGKIRAEELLRKAHRERGFPATIIRPPVIYGPDNYMPEREFAYFARITQDRKLIIPGDGKNIFHPVHVDDLVAAYVAVPGNSKAIGQSYNIEQLHGTTFDYWFNTIAEVMGKTVEIVHPDGALFDRTVDELGVTPPNGFVYYWGASYLFDTEKARRELDWAPKYDIKEGLAMTYKWWVEQGLDNETWDFSPEDRLLEAFTSSA